MRTVSCHPWFAGVAGIVGRHLSLRTRPHREVGRTAHHGHQLVLPMVPVALRALWRGDTS